MLRLGLVLKRAHTRDIATGAMQAADDPAPGRIAATYEDDRYGRGRGLRRQGRWLATYCNNDGHLLTHESGGEPRQSIVLTVSPTIVEGDVLTLDQACFIQTLADDRNERHVDSGRTATQQCDHWNRALLRASGQRPRRRTAD